MSLSWTIHSPAGSQRRPISQPRTVSLSSADSPSLSHGVREASTATHSEDSPHLLTHLPKSFDHFSIPQSSEGESNERAMFAQSLISSQTSGGRRGKGGRDVRESSPLEEDFVAGRGSKVASFIPRFHDDSLVSLPDSREDPDGQSDISNVSPEAIVIRHESTPETPVETMDTPSVCSLTPPPSTPLTTNGNSFKSTITPLMIQSALVALQQIQNKDTPISTGGAEEGGGGHSPIFPEEVTTALTAWINQQHNRSAGSSELQTPLLSPPPCTPQRPESESDNVSAVINLDGTGPGAGMGMGASVRHGISASDLITALSSLIAQDSTTDVASGESSGVCSVPACTPKEGLSEWLRMGIRPDEVIQALSALTISRAEQEGEGKEEPKVTLSSHVVTKYEEFPLYAVVSDADEESDQEGEREKEEVVGHPFHVDAGTEAAVGKDSCQSLVIASGKPKGMKEGTEKEEEKFGGEKFDKEDQKHLRSVDPPIAQEDDSVFASEEAMGIKLLNELSFLSDPLLQVHAAVVPMVTESPSVDRTGERTSLDEGAQRRENISPAVDPFDENTQKFNIEDNVLSIKEPLSSLPESVDNL